MRNPFRWTWLAVVIYRKISFSTRGEQGSRFIERILTTVTTLKQQKRNVLEFLRETL